MSFEVVENAAIGERYYKTVIDGLRVLVSPKKLSSCFAVLGVDFGSSDIFCRQDGKEKLLTPGTAHFLEHKMFENGDGSDAFEQFSQSGANANAYTAASRTCYMFSCTENWEENLKLLLRVVSTPHFTEEAVEREKPIIFQEIRMYTDDPYWRMHFSLLNAMYSLDPIRLDPAGTEESVAAVTPAMLYEAYGMFYKAENMVLCICGDVEPEAVERAVKSSLRPQSGLSADKLRPEEPKELCCARSGAVMEVASPLFAAGIKCAGLGMGEERVRACAENEIILQIIFGKSGSFYNNCYEQGLLGDRFSAYYTCERGASYVMICGSSPDPERVYALIREELQNRKEKLCTMGEFERAKKVCYSMSLDTFNSAEGTASALMSFAFDDSDALCYTEKLRAVSVEDIERRFAEDYDIGRMALSVIRDEEEKK